MAWIIIGAVAAFWLVRVMWRAYAHPATMLGRQAANMDWVYAGYERDASGFRDTKLTRSGMVAVISYANANVVLRKPFRSAPFRDFVELERWLATTKSHETSDSEPELASPADRQQFNALVKEFAEAALDPPIAIARTPPSPLPRPTRPRPLDVAERQRRTEYLHSVVAECFTCSAAGLNPTTIVAMARDSLQSFTPAPVATQALKLCEEVSEAGLSAGRDPHPDVVKSAMTRVVDGVQDLIVLWERVS